MRPGFHTCGLLLHEINLAVQELARLGYQAVAMRPHAGTFHLDQPHFAESCLRLADTLQRHQLTCVFDLDGYFLSCPHRQKATGLLESPESPQAAVEQLIRWFPIANELGATTVTFSSGPTAANQVDTLEEQLDQVASSIDGMLDAARDFQFQLAIRPQHGNCIGSIVRYEQLQQWLGRSGDLGLAADVGEMLSGSEIPIADRLERHLETLACVYLCDRTASEPAIDKDVLIGDGDVSVERIIQSLRRLEFQGPAIIRVEGHAHLGLLPAQQGIELFGS